MWLEIILVLLGIPIGFWLAWSARDELVQGRPWFLSIMVAALLGGLAAYFFQQSVIVWTCIFIIVTTFISYEKSFDKKWTRRRN